MKNIKAKKVIIETLITTGVLASATLIGFLLELLRLEANTFIMIYILGILLIAVYTSRIWYSVISSAVVILLFNFFFVEPRFGLKTLDSSYPVTFIIMFIIGVVVCSITNRLKKLQENIYNVNLQKEKDKSILENEKMRNSILRSISHDIRTPLTSILNGVQKLKHNKADNETLSEIEEESEWLYKLVENILSATKIEQGAMVIKNEIQLAEEIISEVLSRTEKYNNVKRIVCSVPDRIIELSVDSGLIIQVLLNILDNAFKYSYHGTPITFSVSDSSGGVIFEIINEGENISELDLPHIFEMFYRSARDGDKIKGNGVGLAVCQSIVKAHNGTIFAENRDKNKVAFIIKLPKYKEQA